MNNQILNDQTVVYYVVRLNGEIVSQRYQNSVLAEMEKSKLPPEQQALAEVVPITADGNQLLLG
jgi:hypothetical protein